VDARESAEREKLHRTARVFDFPPEAPIIRFLDTRGLGETAYDPSEDMAFCESRSHLILAVVKASDLQQGEVVDALAAAKKRHPDWPMVVAQTTLHERYPPGGRHLLPYPFTNEEERRRVAPDLARVLAAQRSLFDKVKGYGDMLFVPIDFTRPDDGYDPADYGRDALLDALVAAAPAAAAVALAELRASTPGWRSFDAHILGFALAAGASDAVPVAGAVVAPVVQAAMLRQLAQRHGSKWDRRAYAEFLSALGAGALVRAASSFGLRQLAKMIPMYGQTAGAVAAAAASFATTYALGKAAVFYLDKRDRHVRGEEVAAVYRKALQEAFALARERKIDEGGSR
jgi:uncharacterized protein (DUF697 family)